MAWCPKCKSEYREGYTVCADCGCELVEELPREESPTAEDFATGENFDAGEEPGAEETLTGQQEAEEEDSPYRDSAEQANDNRSSGWILLVIGALGIAVVVTGILNLLPLSLGNPYLFYGVLSAVSVLFFVSGIMSFKSARLFQKKAESENTLRGTLTEWCTENLQAEAIDREVRASEDTEEVLYFKRTEWIKARLNHQFVNLDQSFLDMFIDESVYDAVFGEKQE